MESTANNLRLLANKLDSLAGTGAELKMRSFLHRPDGEESTVDNEAVIESLKEDPFTCGCSACALGWAATMPEFPYEPFIVKDVDSDKIEFMRFSEHYFPALGMTSIWRAVFGSHLSNDFKDAGTRCRIVADYIDDIGSFFEPHVT